MCAGEKPSANAVKTRKPGGTAHSCHGETPVYRARTPGPVSQIVLNNLQEFEQWLKNPADLRARPQPGVITTLGRLMAIGPDTALA